MWAHDVLGVTYKKYSDNYDQRDTQYGYSTAVRKLSEDEFEAAKRAIVDHGPDTYDGFRSDLANEIFGKGAVGVALGGLFGVSWSAANPQGRIALTVFTYGIILLSPAVVSPDFDQAALGHILVHEGLHFRSGITEADPRHCEIYGNARGITGWSSGGGITVMPPRELGCKER